MESIPVTLQSDEENHYPAAGASDERMRVGEAVGNLVKYANRAESVELFPE